MTESVSEPVTVTVDHVETALRDWLAHFEYDLHKATECGEDDGTDTYPDEAANFFACLQAATEQQPPTITVAAHDNAWHAIEGAIGDPDADVDTVLNAVLHALRINPPSAADETAAILRKRPA